MSASATVLVLGGARSGKSSFAERLITESAQQRFYLATATDGDDEMHERIAHHRARRGEGWCTIEEPLDLVGALMDTAARDRAVLVDCLTLWLSNLMHAGRDPAREGQRLADWLAASPGMIVLVSNEVGLGLVPETALGRSFRDAQGPPQSNRRHGRLRRRLRRRGLAAMAQTHVIPKDLSSRSGG